MTIVLQTGLPGACKTLYTLDRIEKQRRKTGRPVFYHGINIYPEKLPDWQKLDDPKDWFKCPPESIVILDEAQHTFRPRPSGSAVPEFEAKLETHRHGGIDLILLTQRPRLVSVNVRELVGLHYHAHRIFGLQRSTIYRWSECKMNTQSRRDADASERYAFNKEVFTWYKSAEAHTMQASVPFKVWALIALVFALPVLAFVIYQQLSHQTEKPTSPTQLVSRVGSSTGPVDGPGKHLSQAQYVAQFQPRVQGLEYTAPAYDEVTRPVHAPYPAACVQSKTRCQCYSQQGTRLQVPQDLCEGIAAGGFFMAWDERERAVVPRAMPAPVQPEKTGGEIGGLINLTPGHEAKTTQVASAEQVQQDGQGIRAARRQP